MEEGVQQIELTHIWTKLVEVRQVFVQAGQAHLVANTAV